MRRAVDCVAKADVAAAEQQTCQRGQRRGERPLLQDLQHLQFELGQVALCRPGHAAISLVWRFSRTLLSMEINIKVFR